MQVVVHSLPTSSTIPHRKQNVKDFLRLPMTSMGGVVVAPHENEKPTKGNLLQKKTACVCIRGALHRHFGVA